MLTPAVLLANGLKLEMPEAPPKPLPPGAVSAISGQPISEGYLVQEAITSATAEYLDQFRGNPFGYVSVDEMRCYASSSPKKGNPCARSHLAFEDVYWGPLVNMEAALQQGRPYWSKLVREVWPSRKGQACLVLLTDDTKKRLWYKAAVGVLGKRTRVFIHNGDVPMSSEVSMDWSRMLDALDLLEEVYCAGFSKITIQKTLLADTKNLDKVGYAQAMNYERLLKPYRGSPELLFAAIIGQRTAEWKPRELQSPAPKGRIVDPKPETSQPAVAKKAPIKPPKAEQDSLF